MLLIVPDVWHVFVSVSRLQRVAELYSLFNITPQGFLKSTAKILKTDKQEYYKLSAKFNIGFTSAEMPQGRKY